MDAACGGIGSRAGKGRVMSDTSAIDPTMSPAARKEPGEAKPAAEAGEVKPADEAGAAPSDAPAEKPQQRPVSEIRADIEKERGELSGSFAQLRGELDEAVDAGKQRVSDAGKKAKRLVPVVAGAVVTLVVAGSLLRRRSRR